MNKAKARKLVLPQRKSRKKARHSGSGTRLLPAVLRSFAAGVGTATAILCLLSVAFANTSLPLNWIGPAACGAAAVGAFVSGLLISRAVPRLKLLAGLGFGCFYCLCTITASLLASRIPTVDSTNLSLLAVLLLGALTGSTAGALQTGSRAAGMH